MSLEITARTRVVGFHRWPDAPPHLDYLASRHRHEFRIAATVAVGHSEREVEFHELRTLIESDLVYLADGAAIAGRDLHRGKIAAYDFGTRSCETIAQGIAGRLTDRNYRVLAVTVSEDGENDATWRPDTPGPDLRTAAIPSQSAALPPLGAGR